MFIWGENNEISARKGLIVVKKCLVKSNFYNFATELPDRLRAGLQFLVLTMLVRIQLGQLLKSLSLAKGFFHLQKAELARAFCK